MKKFTFFIFLPSVLFFTSCEKDETTQIVSTKISQSFVFDVNEDDPTALNLEIVVDPSQDPTLQPYDGSILNYNITNITNTYSEYGEENAPNVLLNGIFYDKEFNYQGREGSSNIWYNFTDIDLQDFGFPRNTEIDAPFEETELSSLSERLNKEQEFPIRFKGEVSDSPLNFVITFTFYIEATVPL